MNSIRPVAGFLTFWVLLGIVLAGAVLFVRGDLQLRTQTAAPIHGKANSFADAVALASPAVVSVAAHSFVNKPTAENASLLDRFLGSPAEPRPQRSTRTKYGSGVILDAQGHIVTSLHVVNNADRLSVALIDGRQVTAELVGSDPETDLAVLKIALPDLPLAQPADIDRVRIGDVTLAIGFPFELGQTVTQGIISATGRNTIDTTYQNFLQTDAAINPGNSGGALINTEGEVIGINSLIYSNNGNFQGIGFAIPIDMAAYVLQQIKRKGYVTRGWLGVEGQNVPPAMLQKLGLKDVAGVLITGVEPDGPAQRAGIQMGDIITHINGEPIAGINDIITTISSRAPGDTLTIGGLRQRNSFSTEATLIQRPSRSR